MKMAFSVMREYQSFLKESNEMKFVSSMIFYFAIIYPEEIKTILSSGHSP
jgi:hypothetical protein